MPIGESRKSGAVLGISAHYHDSAAALLVDGELVAAAQEERFSRRKHDPALPIKSALYCLEAAGISIDQIDRVAYYEDPYEKLGRNLWMLTRSLSNATARFLLSLNPARPRSEIRRLLGYEGEIRFYGHHRSHAASAYYYSGFDRSAVMVVDGVGEWQTLSLYGADKGRLKLLEDVFFPHSIGLLYAAITAYLGFDVNDGEYKVMGLAPYGRPEYVDRIRKLVKVSSQGAFRLDMSYFDFMKHKRMYSDKLVRLMGEAPREKESPLTQFHQDMAKSLQCVLEDILIEKAEHLYRLFPSENLCMAGGVALNCVANGKVRREGPFANLFVQPAASDAGSALGAAALAYRELDPAWRGTVPMQHVFLGPSFSDACIGNLLGAAECGAMDFSDSPENLFREVADALSQGKIIGWFQERMEFGPRSLGARSILADPRGEDMRTRINALVKKREAFRPFAPAVLEERVSEHFDLARPSPFMLETCQVVSHLQLPAITHVDGSARVQTVTRSQNRMFAGLLEAFHAKTGCPILLNTSFNMRGEPIVCTPAEAIVCFLRAKLDCLVLGSFVLHRERVPARWIEWFESTYPERREGVSNAVYTFL
jgi:carbamoyltransferase